MHLVYLHAKKNLKIQKYAIGTFRKMAKYVKKKICK